MATFEIFFEEVLFIHVQAYSIHALFTLQAEEVHNRLEELLTLVESEYAPEANYLCAQMEAIRASFFQLECDRIKEKLAQFLYLDFFIFQPITV